MGLGNGAYDVTVIGTNEDEEGLEEEADSSLTEVEEVDVEED